MARLRDLWHNFSGLYQAVMDPQAAAVARQMDESIVILGGGLTGLATACYLAQEQKQIDITVVDPSSRICAGASSQNEGVIGSFGMKPPLEDLALWSGTLHKEIAKSTSRQTYGYAGLDSYVVFSHGYDPENPKLPYPPQKQVPLSQLPPWLKAPDTWDAGLVTTRNDTNRVDAGPFCSYLQSECERLGVRYMFQCVAESVDIDTPAGDPRAVAIRDRRTGQSEQIPCTALVVAAGSWSADVMTALFPDARVQIPMSKNQPIQSWIRLRVSPPPSPSAQDSINNQVWLGPALADGDLHLSNYTNGDFFVAGPIENASYPLELPEDINMTHEDVERMHVNIQKYLQLADGTTTNVVASGRACMPQLTQEVPIIDKAPLAFLLPRSVTIGHDAPSIGRIQRGVYVNVGQNLDGLTLAPASGKLMSEIIFGKATSIDPAPFAFPR